MGSAGIWRNCAFVRETNLAPIPFRLTPAPPPFSAMNSTRWRRSPVNSRAADAYLRARVLCMWELERVNLARSIAGLFLSSCRPSSETYARLPVTLAGQRSPLGPVGIPGFSYDFRKFSPDH